MCVLTLLMKMAQLAMNLFYYLINYSDNYNKEVTEITANSAKSGGIITADGGATINSRE